MQHETRLFPAVLEVFKRSVALLKICFPRRSRYISSKAAMRIHFPDCRIYSPVQGFICIVICTFSIVTNLVHTLVLTRPNLRCSGFYNITLLSYSSIWLRLAATFGTRSDLTPIACHNAVFLVAEMPQGIIAIMNAVYTTHVHEYIYFNFGDILDLLSLLNLSIIFILYCLMFSRYRKTFWTVMLPKYLSSLLHKQQIRIVRNKHASNGSVENSLAEKNHQHCFHQRCILRRSETYRRHLQ
uniref:G-protein coupled receptors family 1 profile domain-containing protein n=1 Tax=Onchocerca volvulus TaxID=6282 RepID=A0A8R1TWL2_ONCVO